MLNVIQKSMFIVQCLFWMFSYVWSIMEWTCNVHLNRLQFLHSHASLEIRLRHRHVIRVLNTWLQKSSLSQVYSNLSALEVSHRLAVHHTCTVNEHGPAHIEPWMFCACRNIRICNLASSYGCAEHARSGSQCRWDLQPHCVSHTFVISIV